MNRAHYYQGGTSLRRRLREVILEKLPFTEFKYFIPSSSCKYPLLIIPFQSLHGLLISEIAQRLLFMTYNGWVMIAVAAGASLGYILWGGASAAKSVACH